MRKLIFLLFLVPVIASAQLKHNDSTYVDDYADVFTPGEEHALDQVIRSFFDTVQISIVTIPSFDGEDPAQYTLELGRRWGVGGKSNNGLILVIGVDDHHMQVATGPGVEGDLPDIKVVDLQKEIAVPLFKQKQYFQGTYELVKAYINELSPSAQALREKERQVQKERREKVWDNFVDGFLKFLMGLGGAILICLPFYLRWRKKEQQRKQIEEARRYENVAPKKQSEDYKSNYKSSYNSNDSYRQSYDSGSSGSSSSSSDFGGGSFSGGGGGSDW